MQLHCTETAECSAEWVHSDGEGEAQSMQPLPKYFGLLSLDHIDVVFIACLKIDICVSHFADAFRTSVVL